MRRLIGLAYRRQLARWIETCPPELQYLEITAEQFLENGERKLSWLAEQFPISVYTRSLSFGAPGDLDRSQLMRLTAIAASAEAEWLSAPAGTPGAEPGSLLAVERSAASLARLSAQAMQLMEASERPLLLVNYSPQATAPGAMPEPEFLSRLCADSGCGLLLDLTHLWINAQNQGFEAQEWLAGLDASVIRQLHISGYSRGEAGYADAHAARVQPELLRLLTQVCAHAPVESVILQRDSSFPEAADLLEELSELELACVAPL